MSVRAWIDRFLARAFGALLASSLLVVAGLGCGPTGAPNACIMGGECDGDREFCCDGDDSILQCVDGVFEVQERCDGPLARCSESTTSGPSCTCMVGTIDCIDSASEQRCLPGLPNETEGRPEVFACPSGQTCISGSGCEMCFDRCVVDDLQCSIDGTEVLRCTRVPPDNCAHWVPALSCGSSRMHCDEPSFQTDDEMLYCVNECAGRGTPLAHEECERAGDGEPPCAVYICDGQGGLRLDHVACFPGGADCTSDAQCTSCRCLNGSCQGNTEGRCPGGEQCTQ